MQLFTHHPSDCLVDDPNLEVDYKKGQYSQPDMVGVNGFRYCEVLAKLYRIVKTEQFLWCCTKQGEYPRAMEDEDSMEWELNVPLSQIRTFYRVHVWEDIVWNRNDDWDRLLLAVGETEPAANDLNDLGALVRVPLAPKWAKCHGRVPLA